MQILALNAIKLNPVFKSSLTNGEEKTQKSDGQIPPSSSGMVYPINKTMLSQRFNFRGAEQGVDPKDRTYDRFTGLGDKHYLMASLEVAMQRAQSENKPLSVAMLDMDDFKSVNELLGYKTGDVFIEKIGGDIGEVAKEHNVGPYRFGGEEFILIFDGESDLKKKEIAHAISKKVNSDSGIQSYGATYVQNAQERLNNVPDEVSKIYQISELRQEKKYLEKTIKRLFAEGDEINSKIDEIYGSLIQDCMNKETDEENRAMLMEAQKKLQTGESLQGAEREKMDGYLSFFYKIKEAEQVGQWMYDFRQNHGFGFTCGVVNFAPESLRGKTPMDVIEKAGNVLKNGKSTRKGRVYFEDVKKW